MPSSLQVTARELLFLEVRRILAARLAHRVPIVFVGLVERALTTWP
jgi:hypothetical protein